MDSHAGDMPKTVLMITDHERLYGANRTLLDLAVYLRDKRGIKPIVLIQRPGRLSEALTEKGIENHCVLFRKWCHLPGDVKKLEGLCNLYDWWQRQKIVRLMAKKHIDLVHTNVSTTCVGDYIAQKLRVPHVWHVREFVPEAFPYVYNLPMAEVKARYSRADAVIAISHALADAFKGKYPDANVRFVYNGISQKFGPKAFSPVPVVSFCCVGRLCYQKNQMEILQALAILKRRGKDFRAHFYGEGSDRAYEDGLYELVKSEGMDEQVVFHGYSPSVVEDLPKYDVGLVVSRFEAFGRTTMEFMNASMPVIGAQSGATPELITEGEDGFICPLDKPEAMADAMQRFIDDPALIESMGKHAFEKAGMFTAERAVTGVCQVYADCIAARKARSGAGK